MLWRATSVTAVGGSEVAVGDDGGPVSEGPAPDEVVAGRRALRFDDVFAREYRSVVGLAFVLVGRRSVAEELAQDGFLAAYRRWDRIGHYDDPGAWVRHVVANMATSFWRTRSREVRALARLDTRRRDPVEIETGDDEFWAAVRALPRRQAQCVALRYLEDRTVADIATVLHIAEPTVRVHLHTARRALAERLGEQLDEEDGR
jgi:RNA polymerase sigma factor (sigma-70 family)